jgi:hypothetical protein
MTEQKQTAERIVTQAEYLLVKRGLYYRPDRKGYTGIKSEAGRYLESDATPDCGVFAVHQDGAPQFSERCFPDVAITHLNRTITEMADALRVLIEQREGHYSTDAAWENACAVLAKLGGQHG